MGCNCKRVKNKRELQKAMASNVEHILPSFSVKLFLIKIILKKAFSNIAKVIKYKEIPWIM